MDLRKLKKLIDLVQESGISELEVTEGEEKVRIAKHLVAPMAAPVAYAGSSGSSGRGRGLPRLLLLPRQPQQKAMCRKVNIVKSPMVGTFYRSSSPGSKPFCRRGPDRGRGRSAVPDRSHEVDERDRSRRRWCDQGRPR